MNEPYTRAPHRRSSADTVRHTAALLIDFDNVTMGIRSNLGQELRNFLDSDIIRGKVAVQRAYADWRRYPQYIVPLSESSVDLIFAPAYGSSKKNATDIRLAIDALELVFIRPEIETFILLSGDSDFSSLVLKLKEYGKYVIGVGLQESTSDILVQNCDEYYSYNRLSGLTSADEIQTEKHDPWELAGKAVARMAERGDVMRSDRLKQVMLEMDPGFDEKTVGFSRFNRFLGEAARRERIVLSKRENGQYDVAPPGGTPSRAPTDSVSRKETPSTGGGGAASRSRGRRGRRGGSGRGRGRPSAGKTAVEPAPEKATASSDDALRGAYRALARAIRDLSPEGAPVRDSMAKRKLLEYDAAFDEGTFGFSKFSLFLRAAHEAGVVRLARHEDGNHYLTPGAGGAGAKGAAAPGPKADRADSPQDRDSGTAAKSDAAGGRSALSAAAAAARKTLGRLRRGPPPRDDRPMQAEDPSRSRPETPKAREKTTESKPASRSPRQPAPKREAGPVRRDRSRGQSPRAKEARVRDGSARQAPSPGSRPAEPKREAAGRKSEPPKHQRKPAERQRPPVEPKRPPVERQAEAAERPSESTDSQSAAPRRTLGRYRSGSRGRTPAPRAAGAKGGHRIGPIAKDDVPAEPAPKKARRGTGNVEPAAEEGRKAAGTGRRTGRTGGGSGKPAGGPVGHMVRTYAGVGKRTAEILFEHFGEQVFDVIDSSPERLTEVLSEGRAKIVREARRAERES
ncbi:NYN domain-containing protein [Candidatus Palauibacter sp.]|uniref:NYN domain-containing protein n=1 Tax=Candidatus Palauibacter sp. TaxID=3101350 RepID=UPI003AF30136